MRIQKILFTGMLLMGIATTSAQTTEQNVNVFKPHWYIQAQGGAQYTLGEIPFKDLISGNAQLNVGWQFHKVVGARLSFNGWQSKAGWENSDKVTYKWKWNYVSGGIDFAVDLCTLLGGYNPKRVCTVNLLAGGGVNLGWNNQEAADNNLIFNQQGKNLEYLWKGHAFRGYGRVGAAIDFRLCDAVSLGIELNANTLQDKYNSKKADNTDWYFNALAGVRVNLGKTHTTKTPATIAPVVVEKVVEKIVEKPVEKIVYREKPAPEKPSIRRDIFFSINSTKVTETESKKVQEIAEFLKKYPEAKVNVAGAADKGTGTNTINERLAGERANVINEILQKQYGIPANRINVISNGDRVQPFTENDMNRCTICIAE